MSLKDRDYATVGTVTIGTDEYRDLIEENIANEKDASSYRSKFWAEETKVKELENQLSGALDKLTAFTKFMKEVDGVADKFKLWRLENSEEADNTDSI